MCVWPLNGLQLLPDTNQENTCCERKRLGLGGSRPRPCRWTRQVFKSETRYLTSLILCDKNDNFDDDQ